MSENADVRHDWAVAEIENIYNLPLTELVYRAQTIHRQYHSPIDVQGCALLSVKTGGCPEDCAYCPQSAHYKTGLTRTELMKVDDVLAAAQQAKTRGATRFCLGAAWRDAPHGTDFNNILDMVRGIRALDMEACCTLGMLTQEQADALAGAGLTAYNHNLDTSPEFYGDIISTRTYTDRLETIARVRQAGITVCCGGILGLGEERRDRYELIAQLAALRPHPESVPINVLVKVAGTPLEESDEIEPTELVRMIATARITMPKSIVRLSAGRLSLSVEAQVLCFMAGANSVFLGDTLLTTPNPAEDKDQQMLDLLGLRLLATPPGSEMTVSSYEDSDFAT